MIERDYYRLPELSLRWGCTVHELLHLGIQGRAQVCVNVYGMASSSSRTRIRTEAPEPEPNSEALTDVEGREAEAHDAAFERWKDCTTKDMPHGVFELEHDVLRFLDMPEAFPYELGEALKFDGRWWACEFDPPVSINLDHLCMLHAEVRRLDREVFGIDVQASEPKIASKVPQPRAEATVAEPDVDPSDLPAELDAAKIAFRAVTNGYGDAATFRNRLIQYLEEHFPSFRPEAVKRIATLANPDKTTGRKGRRD
jgi:hypothetical protein